MQVSEAAARPEPTFRASGAPDGSLFLASCPAVVHPEARDCPLVICFAPLADFTLLSELDRDGDFRAVVVRDVHVSFMFNLVSPEDRHVLSLLAWLEWVVRDTRPTRTVVLGYSTAGFPALLFGHLLGLRYRVDELWAMSPLTAVRVDDANRDKVAHLFGSEAGGLERVEAVRDRVARAGLNPDVVTDVSALAPLSPAQVVLSFSRLHAMDAENARRVAAADPAVKLAALEDTRHHTPLQYWVQERGLVDAVLRGPVPSPHRSHHVPKQIAYDTEWLERQREIRVNHVERMRSD